MAESNISSFDRADSLADNDLLVVLHGGKVMSLPGSVLEAYAAEQSDRVWYGPERPSALNYNLWFDTSKSTTNPTVWMRDQNSEWKGIAGVGVQGQAVSRIERTSGTGAKGETDTYTMYLDDGTEIGEIEVYNGKDGDGQVNTVNGIESVSGNVDISAKNIPISDEDTQTVKGKLDELDSDKLEKAGDTVTGDFTVNGKMQCSEFSLAGLATAATVIPISTTGQAGNYANVIFNTLSNGWFPVLLVSGGSLAYVNVAPNSIESSSLTWATVENIVGTFPYGVQYGLSNSDSSKWRLKINNSGNGMTFSMIQLRPNDLNSIEFTTS